MTVYYIVYEAKPTPESELFNDCGGAFINCWVKAKSETIAIKTTAEAIRENYWEIVAVEEGCRLITEKNYSDDPERLEYYEQAASDGECYVYHQWPNEPQEEDDVH